MIITKPYDYKPIERITGKNGRRYIVGEGRPLPSVTTILSATKDIKPILQWKERVGIEEADRVVTEATSIGNSLHKNLENYILRGIEPEGTLLSKILTKLVIKEGLSKIDEVWGSEVSLYAKDLYAGTADLVGIHTGTP